MKKICFLIAMALMSASSFAQSAKSVLDKAASHITVKDGVKANFKMTGSMGNTSGTILIKGRKFQATTPVATVWFDGKTQWTYVKKNDEVNVTTPTEAQLFVTINKTTYQPTQVKLLRDKKWTIFDITELKKQSVADSQFRFNAKDFPQAEIIDLR